MLPYSLPGLLVAVHHVLAAARDDVAVGDRGALAARHLVLLEGLAESSALVSHPACTEELPADKLVK